MNDFLPVLLVFTDGRNTLSKTLTSLRSQARDQVWYDKVIIDDSGSREYANQLEQDYTDYRIIHHDHRKGFCAAIQSGWASIPPGATHVFHLEDDFIFRELPLEKMATVLGAEPNLIQLALKRQAWSPEEKAVGDLVEMWPAAYVQRGDGDYSWLEHRLFFTTNPSLYRVELTELGWPDPPGCEMMFTNKVLQDPDVVFAFWGKRGDAPWVTHIGRERAGSGY